MTATDELRRLLDERGVEHYDGTERTLWGYEQTGEDSGIYRFAASEISGGFLQFDMFRITPEQAIAATLGRGKCRNVASVDYDYMPNDFRCSECGGIVASNSHSEPLSVIDVEDWSDGEWKFCPICGRMVV